MERGVITISETGVVTMPTAPVWMTKFEIATCSECSHTIFARRFIPSTRIRNWRKLKRGSISKQPESISYDIYNIEMIIAIAFRVCSKESVLLRQFVISKISTATKETPITLFVSCSRGNNLWYS